jgi:hypothetical protein
VAAVVDNPAGNPDLAVAAVVDNPVGNRASSVDVAHDRSLRPGSRHRLEPCE